MTKVQEISLKLSEKRQAINDLLGKDDLTDEQRADLDKLTRACQGLESEYRAALVVEGQEQAEARGQFGNGDGQPAEIRTLLHRVNLTDYLSPAAGGVGLVGAPAELNAALKLDTMGKGGGVLVPWDMLETRQAETRADTTTTQLDGGTMQRPILQRLFGPGIMDALGVRMDTVPAGKSEWPLLATGVAPDMKAEGGAADAAVAATFTREVLKPKRLTGRYEFTHEIAAEVADLEQGLRRDLADAVKSKMSDRIINGDEATNAFDVDGFLTTVTAPTDASTEATFSDYGGAHAQGVDGIHAEMETQVQSVIGTDVYTHAASVYQTGSGESGSEALAKRSGGCVASSYIPAASSGISSGNIIHAAGPNGGGIMRGDSVAAMWPTLEVIRDIYTNASTGVMLTWVTLWDAQTAFRSAAYRRLSFKITPDGG